jgi:hypothetical protein
MVLPKLSTTGKENNFHIPCDMDPGQNDIQYMNNIVLTDFHSEQAKMRLENFLRRSCSSVPLLGQTERPRRIFVTEKEEMGKIICQ